MKPIDFTALLPEADQDNLGGRITLLQACIICGAVAVLGLLITIGHIMHGIGPHPTGSVLDYRPAPIAGNLGEVITPAEAKARFMTNYPAWQEGDHTRFANTYRGKGNK